MRCVVVFEIVIRSVLGKEDGGKADERRGLTDLDLAKAVDPAAEILAALRRKDERFARDLELADVRELCLGCDADGVDDGDGRTFARLDGLRADNGTKHGGGTTTRRKARVRRFFFLLLPLDDGPERRGERRGEEREGEGRGRTHWWLKTSRLL